MWPLLDCKVKLHNLQHQHIVTTTTVTTCLLVILVMLMCVYIFNFLSLSLYIYIYAYMYTYIYIYIYTHVYICVYTYDIYICALTSFKQIGHVTDISTFRYDYPSAIISDQNRGATSLPPLLPL